MQRTLPGSLKLADVMRICIIDDNALIRDALTLVLSDAGHEILFAENGFAGLELAVSQKLDAAVIDYQLPDMNGDTVAAAIRAARPRLPIVLVSGGFVASPDTGDAAAQTFHAQGATDSGDGGARAA